MNKIDLANIIVNKFKKALGDSLLALSIETNLAESFNDIDFGILVNTLNKQNYTQICEIIDELGKEYDILLDPFIYELPDLSIPEKHNAYIQELVKKNSHIVYGYNFYNDIVYDKDQIQPDRVKYLRNHIHKFERYMKNIKRIQTKWITEWALDHLFVFIKAWNSLYNYYSLGKKKNLAEYKLIAKDEDPRYKKIEKLYNIGKNQSLERKEAIEYLAECYLLSEELFDEIQSSENVINETLQNRV